MTALRRHLWRDYSLDRLMDGWQEPSSTAIGQDGWANPQLATQRLAIWAIINDVVENDLTARQRAVLNQVVINGVPTEIVEDELGMTASALYKMTHDARRKLKAGLIRRGFSPAEILQVFTMEG
jgi:RNA polymerase sigma-70 factor (ECF subfamily)